MSKTVSSNRSKGDYYYRKTVTWLEKRGYTIAKLEQSKVTKIRGRFIVVRSDIWGSDGMALSPDRLVFFQVKFNQEKRNGSYYQARKYFQAMKTPANVEKWIIEWRPRIIDPSIEVIP